MITLRQYYFFAIWLPIIVPLVLLNVLGVDYKSQLIILGFYGVVPYIIFTIWAILKYRSSPTEELREFGMVAPLQFGVAYIVQVILVIACTAIYYTNLSNDYIYMFFWLIFMTAVVMFIVIPTAYFYVAIANGLAFILQKIGFIKPEQPSIISGNE